MTGEENEGVSEADSHLTTSSILKYTRRPHIGRFHKKRPPRLRGGLGREQDIAFLGSLLAARPAENHEAHGA